jgi:hypothetical protein
MTPLLNVNVMSIAFPLTENGLKRWQGFVQFNHEYNFDLLLSLSSVLLRFWADFYFYATSFHRMNSRGRCAAYSSSRCRPSWPQLCEGQVKSDGSSLCQTSGHGLYRPDGSSPLHSLFPESRANCCPDIVKHRWASCLNERNKKAHTKFCRG